MGGSPYLHLRRTRQLLPKLLLALDPYSLVMITPLFQIAVDSSLPICMSVPGRMNN